MKKGIIIFISICCAVWLAYVFLMPDEPETSELTVISQRDSLQIEFNKLQASYDLVSLLNSKKEAELIISLAAVKRSEEKLTQAKANEKRVLRLVKEQTRLMSDMQADSVLKSRYQYQDSILQRTVVDLLIGDVCKQIRHQQDSLLDTYRHEIQLQQEFSTNQKTMIEYSREQILILQSSSLKDQQLIDIKDKEIKKLKRREKILKIMVPVAVVLTAVLLL